VEIHGEVQDYRVHQPLRDTRGNGARLGEPPPSSREAAARDSRAVKNAEEAITTYNRALPGHPRRPSLGDTATYTANSGTLVQKATCMT